MIPDYLTFMRFQDRKIIPFFFLIVFLLLGLFWKNVGYEFVAHDAAFISGILAIVLFHFTYELRAYWAYKCVVKNIDFSWFAEKKLWRYETILAHPAIASLLAGLVFWLMAKACFLFSPPGDALAVLCLVSPLFLYSVFRLLRTSYIKQLASTSVEKVKYKHLYRYLAFYLFLSVCLSLLTIAPLKHHPEFNLAGGFFSAPLMVAMLVLCAIVLVVNLVFVRLSRRYIFLGRLFLQEIDFYFSAALPTLAQREMPFWLRMALLVVVEAVWIMLVSMLLALVGGQIAFEVYFLLCWLPCLAYSYLHIYALWHSDFLMACDMYLRWGEINKQSSLW
ncbi:hypothetical protein Q5705_08750 [Kosakonia sp. H02]|nr:hypothetical protein Q5705_08750 [Kosakonia sp. H02]